MADKLPWKAAAAKVGDFLVLPGDEVAEVITIPEVKPGKVPVAWATIRESTHKNRIGETLIVSLFAIVEGAPQPGQVQLKKSLAEVVTVKPVEVKDLTKLSPIDYALWVESDGRITQDMRDLAGKYEDFSDKKLVGLLQERNLSQAGISYDKVGRPENFVKSEGLFLKLQRPSVIARIAYHEAKGRERVPIKREPVKPEPEKPKVEPRKEEPSKGRALSPSLDGKRITIRAKEGSLDYPLELTGTYYHRPNRTSFEFTTEGREGEPRQVFQRDEWELALEAPAPEPAVHYGPPESASPEVKVQWNRMLGEIRRQYPLGETVLENEAKRMGITPKEMQLMIAQERWGKRK